MTAWLQKIQQLDAEFFLKINGLSGSWGDYFLAWPTYFGNSLILFSVVLVYLLIWDERKFVVRNYLFVIIPASMAGFAGHFIKHAVQRLRPYTFFRDQIVQGKVVVNVIFGLTLSHSSFPSGHAIMVFGTATALNLVYHNRLKFLYPLALYVSFSRIYVGAHFPSDIVGGMAVGIAASFSIFWMLKKLLPQDLTP